MIVAIYAYVDTFYGYHELEDYCIKKVNDVFEADDLANDMCEALIKGYINDDFLDMVEGDYEIYKLKLSKLPVGKKFRDLLQNFSLDKNIFLKMYDAKRLF